MKYLCLIALITIAASVQSGRVLLKKTYESNGEYCQTMKPIRGNILRSGSSVCFKGYNPSVIVQNPTSRSQFSLPRNLSSQAGALIHQVQGFGNADMRKTISFKKGSKSFSATRILKLTSSRRGLSVSFLVHRIVKGRKVIRFKQHYRFGCIKTYTGHIGSNSQREYICAPKACAPPKHFKPVPKPVRKCIRRASTASTVINFISAGNYRTEVNKLKNKVFNAFKNEIRVRGHGRFIQKAKGGRGPTRAYINRMIASMKAKANGFDKCVKRGTPRTKKVKKHARAHVCFTAQFKDEFVKLARQITTARRLLSNLVRFQAINRVVRSLAPKYKSQVSCTWQWKSDKSNAPTYAQCLRFVQTKKFGKFRSQCAAGRCRNLNRGITDHIPLKVKSAVAKYVGKIGHRSVRGARSVKA